MTSRLRQFAAAAIAALAIPLPASGNTFGIDYTDLWYNPVEAGWGINLVHQYNTIFATMFVYEADRSPHWFVASEMNGSGTSYSGTLFQTSGPGYQGAWTGGVTVPAVGSISINFTSANTATMSYTANGVVITKSITRQTFRTNNIAGAYYGGFSGTASGCTQGQNGLALAVGLLTVSHANFQSGGTVSIELRFLSNNVEEICTYTGPYSAQGRLGSISGNYSCRGGNAGTFSMTEVDATRNGFNATYSARDQFNCNFSGYFGGPRDVR